MPKPRNLITISDPTFAVTSDSKIYMTGVVLERAGFVNESLSEFYQSIESGYLAVYKVSICLPKGISLIRHIKPIQFYVKEINTTLDSISCKIWRLFIPMLQIDPQEAEIMCQAGVMTPDNTHPI